MRDKKLAGTKQFNCYNDPSQQKFLTAYPHALLI